MSTTLVPADSNTKPEDAADQTADTSPIPEFRVVRINTLYDNLTKQEAGAIADRIELGRELREVKSKLPHGKFKSWLKANCPKISHRRADEFMQAAERLKAMPDLMDKLPGRSFAAFQKLVAEEWKKRAKRTLNELVDCEREILDCHARIRVAVLRVVDLTGDEIGFQEWRTLFDLADDAIMAGWTQQTDAMVANGFGRKRDLPDDADDADDAADGTDGRTVPAALFPNPDVRRAEEEIIAAAKVIGIAPVKVEEKRADLTPDEQRADHGYADSDLVESDVDDSTAEEAAGEPAAPAA